jgi:hypothetical protein
MRKTLFMLTLAVSAMLASCSTTSISTKATSTAPLTSSQTTCSSGFRGTFYAVNGLAGDLPAIGYGMNNLQRKVTCVSPAYSRHSEDRIEKEIIALHKAGKLKRPLILVGHSLGGNVVTRIIRDLQSYGIVVDYAAIIDAPMPVKIESNVKVIDNFLSTKSTIGKKLTRGNEIVLQGVDHIPMGNDPKLQSRILSQSGM